MADRLEFTPQETEEAKAIYLQLKDAIGQYLLPGDEEKIHGHLKDSMEKNRVERDHFGLNPILFGFQTAKIVVEEIGLKRDALLDEQLCVEVDLVGEGLGREAALLVGHGEGSHSASIQGRRRMTP